MTMKWSQKFSVKKTEKKKCTRTDGTKRKQILTH